MRVKLGGVTTQILHTTWLVNFVVTGTVHSATLIRDQLDRRSVPAGPQLSVHLRLRSVLRHPEVRWHQIKKARLGTPRVEWVR